jgi:hypothetical protein
VLSDEQEALAQTRARTHPCWKLLEQVSAGFKPPAESYAAVIAMAAPSDRSAVRQRLLEVTESCHALRNQGALKQCRDVARGASFELAPTLGPHRPPPAPLPNDPAGLAKLISRSGPVR